MNNYLKNIIKPLLPFIMILASATGCGDFLDINKDPNNPLDAQLKLVLPVAETVIFEAMGNGPGGMSDLTSQFIHQTVQRGTSNFYFVAGNENNISNAWPNMYSGALKDVEIIIKKATERQSWTYLGIAQVLKAYSYSAMVDLWGKAAYFDFGKGTENPFPKFDEGEAIYPELFKLLKEAAINLGKVQVEPIGKDDLIFGGDADKWKRLANSLQLKLYNQVRLTTLYDATAVADIVNSGTLVKEVAGGFKLKYANNNNPENRHPLFIQDYVNQNANYIDPYFYLIMNGDPRFNPILSGIIDPRIPYYFYNQLNSTENAQNPVTTAKFGNFLSIWFASFNIDPNEGFDQGNSQTVVGLYPCGGAFDDTNGVNAGVAAGRNPGLGGAGYQRIYPYFADLYTRAELALTMAAPGDPRTLFKSAMEASFDEVNELAPNDITVTSRDSYVNAVLALYDVASANGKLELVLTEKWIASFGFSVDSYTDYRRTGFPLMFDPATDNNPVTILNRAYPVSIPYEISDLQINPNAPTQRNPGSDKVFWDK
ncbi:MAG: SusD/RagB family nutrient-binding outer membrane lipoprotein [Cyclobacteriaceae bacterium]